MKLPLTSDVPGLDAVTCATQGITSYELMERAAGLAAQRIMAYWPSRDTRCFVMAGPGNNGGDAMVIARLLYDAGYAVLVYLFNPKGQLSADCAEASRQLPPGMCYEVTSQFQAPEVNKGDILIDGLFGSGLNRPLEGGFAYVVQLINSCGVDVISIDVPSGLMGESNATNDYRAVVRATLTLTFSAPKLSFLLPEHEEYVGRFEILDIGLDTNALSNIGTPYNYISHRDVAAMRHSRRKFSHKGLYGNAWLAAGSYGMMGAALMAARACMRSGVGLLTVYAPACGYNILQLGLPEAKVECDKHDEIITQLNVPQGCTAVALGPGWGQSSYTAKALKSLLDRKLERLAVIDADALNILSQHSDWLRQLPQNSILTPHPKEADRLLLAAYDIGLLHGNTSTTALTFKDLNSFERLQFVRKLAQELKVVIVLKGAYTAVCLPTGNIWFNVEHGNAGMSTGGSGDVLTGIILGLLAQSYTPAEAAIMGVYLHASAADIALGKQSQESLLPSDIIDHLGKAYQAL